MTLTLCERCEQALRKRERSDAADILERAFAAALRGDGDSVAASLGALGERERFVAVMGVGILFPDVISKAAVGADRDLPPSAVAFRWTDFCASELAAAWAVRVAERVPTAVVARLLGRSPYGTGALLAAVRDRAGRGKVDDARLLLEHITSYQREDHALARMAIARALLPSDSAAARDEIKAALDDATSGEIIETGGEEVEALASVLREIASHRLLAADHELVADGLARMKRLRNVATEQRDQKSWGYSRAAIAAALAARKGDARWLDVADSIASLVYNEQLSQEVALAIQRARAHEEPSEAPEQIERRELDLDALARETDFTRRSSEATAAAAQALEGNQEAVTRRAIALAIAPAESALPTIERVLLSAELADALLAGSSAGHADGASRLADVMRELPVSGSGYTELEMWAAVGRGLLRDAALPSLQPILTDAIARGLARVTYGPSSEKNFVADILACAVARLDAPDLEAALLESVAVVAPHEEQGEGATAREARIAHTLQRLGAARPLEIESRLAGWRAALGAAAPLTSALAELHGRLSDAIALAATRPPRVRAAALVAMADAPLDAAGAKLIVKAFDKCPKTGRDRDAQTMWKFQRAQLLLRVGRFDDAIEALAELPDCRYSGMGPGPLATSIAAALDAHDEWSPERARALVDALAKSGVIAQDLPRPLLRVVGSAYQHSTPSDATLASLANRFRQPADRAIVDAALALGMARADSRAGRDALERALDRVGTQRPFFLRPHHLLEAARACLESDDAAARAAWTRAALTATLFDEREAIMSLGAALDASGSREIALWNDVLGHPKMTKAIAEPLRDRLARRIALSFPTRDEIGALVEMATDVTSTRRRAGWAAVALAQRGQPADAMRILQMSVA